MSNHFPFRFASILAVCAFPVLAGGTVTLRNRSGQDLLVSQADGKKGTPILVTPDGGEGESTTLRLGCDGLEARSPELFSRHDHSEPAARQSILIRNGAAATFAFEQKGADLEANLIIYRLDSESGVQVHGLVVLSLSHKPAAPDGVPEPEARLALSPGPTPRTRTLPCNRNLKLVAPGEMEVLPEAVSRSVDPPDGPMSPLS